MRGWRVVAGLGVAAAIAACFPAYGIGGADGGSGNDGGADSPPGDGTLGGDAVSSGDGRSDGSDAAGQVDGPTSPPSGSALVLADAGNVPTASGTAQQQHVVIAGGNYWLFYFAGVDDQVHTRWSSDFVHWTDGASLTLPMTNAGEGRNLAVATRNIGGVDVVHVATSLLEGEQRIVWDTRATVAGTTITFGEAVKVHDLDYADTWTDAATQYPAGSLGGSYCDPDGTGVTITDDGIVHIATAWVAIPGCCSCDSNFTQSNAPDQGTSWQADAGFQSPLQHYTVTNATHGRQVVPLAGGSLLTGWDQADDSLPSDVVWATDRTGLWSDEDESSQLLVFTSDSFHERQNDWSFCRIDDTHIHALRRAYDSSGGASRVFEHVIFDGTSWASGAPLANDEGLDGSGVVLLSNGTEVLAAAIGDDAQTSVRYATWNGSAWSAWKTAVAAGADGGTVARNYLAGTGCGNPGYAALLWTEGAGAPYSIMGMGVGALFP
jgi:hypothetical protein